MLINGAGVGIIIGFVLILAFAIVWWRRDGGASDQRAAAARAADTRHEQLLRTNPDYNLAARARAFGFALDPRADTVALGGQGTGRYSGSIMRVETEGELTRRITVTRLVALGFLGLGAQKKVDNRELYLSVEGDGFQLVASVDPALGPQARQFAAAYNTRSGALAKQAARPVDVAGEIASLAKLHTDGALTDAEFAAAKARLLGMQTSRQFEPEDERPALG